MDGWDDIDAITADLDNVLSGLDIPDIDDQSTMAPSPMSTPAPVSAPASPASSAAAASEAKINSSKKKKSISMPPTHASQFSSQASPPPAGMAGATPATSTKPTLGMPSKSLGGIPRPVARGSPGAAPAPIMPKPTFGGGGPPKASQFGGGGFKPSGGSTGGFNAGGSPSSFNSATPKTVQPEEVVEEEYNVLERDNPDGSAGTPDYGADNRFGPGSVWFHGNKKRAICEALIKKGPNGTYLVRESTTSRGDYVLSCKESDRMSHYIITSKNGRVTIGDTHFGSIPLLVKNYQTNILETTKLLYPVDFHTDEPRIPQNEKKAKALFNFAGDDDEDLAFSKGELLTVIDQSEPNWWRARDKDGNIGVIPHNYVEILQDQGTSSPPVPNSARPNARPKPSPPKSARPNQFGGGSGTGDTLPGKGGQRGATFGLSGRTRNGSMKKMSTAEAADPSLLAKPTMPGAANDDTGSGETSQAKAIMTCHPNAYDPSALSFKKGDIVTITKKDNSGTWEGEANGKRGHFPCSYVE